MADMRKWRMFMQAYVVAGSYGAAFRVAESLMAKTADHAATRECRVRPYPRLPGQFGVCLMLEAEDMPAAWSALKDGLAQGWITGDDETMRYAIWDRRKGGWCVLDSVQWMNLEIFPEPEPLDL